jgi:hypothetical protein
MKLTRRGIIILDCAFCWVRDNDDQQVKLIEASRMMDINDLKGEVVFLSHAPTLSELMDAIRARYPDAELDSNCCWPDVEWTMFHGEGEEPITHFGATPIAALAALAKEVLS